MNFKTILVGTLVSTMIAGCATKDDLKKATLKNKQELQREISDLKSNLSSRLSSEVKSLNNANKKLDKKIVSLINNQQKIAKSLQGTKIKLSETTAKLVALIEAKEVKDSFFDKSIANLKSGIGALGGNLDESLETFLKKMTTIEKGQNDKIDSINSAFMGMVTNLKNEIKALESALTTQKERLAELDIQSSINTESISNIKKLTSASHANGVEMLKSQINTLQGQLKILNKFGAFLNENSMEEIDDSPDTNNGNSIEEEASTENIEETTPEL